MNDKVIKLIPTEQHAKIKGYRKLTDAEIALMNRIKALEADFVECAIEVNLSLNAQAEAADTEAEQARIDAVINAQTGFLQLIRAVAQPKCKVYLRDSAEFEAEFEANLAADEAACAKPVPDYDIIEEGDGSFDYRINYEELPEDSTVWAIHPQGSSRWLELSAQLPDPNK